jgi:hypothetical protein
VILPLVKKFLFIYLKKEMQCCYERNCKEVIPGWARQLMAMSDYVKAIPTRCCMCGLGVVDVKEEQQKGWLEFLCKEKHVHVVKCALCGQKCFNKFKLLAFVDHGDEFCFWQVTKDNFTTKPDAESALQTVRELAITLHT